MIAMLALAWALPAAAEHGTARPQVNPNNLRFHGDAKETTKVTMLELLKKQKLADYPAATIGKAFDNYRYFSEVAWKEYPALHGKVYFECTGRIKKKWFGLDKSWDGVAVRHLELKFVVSPDGDYGVVMATRIDRKNDDKVVRTPLTDLRVLLDSIYANREISF
jgi:hypothetical protein